MSGLVKLGRAKRWQHDFLPTTAEEVRARGWSELDIIIISGDAYVDHPAFGPPLIARFLEARGFKVGLIAQPDWHSADDFKRLGKPRLFFGISAGNLDSMLNRLTAQKKNRAQDQYSPGGDAGKRPDRATIVYANRAREAFPGTPVVLGGIEASLRRIAHYDYWSDSVRRSILIDAKADLLIFGMGERPVWEVARRLAAGEPASALRDVRGTCYAVPGSECDLVEDHESEHVGDGRAVVLPSYEACAGSKEAYALAARKFHYETSAFNGRPLLQRHGDRGVYFNPPALPLEEHEMDELYDLPFNRAPHPSYGTAGVPAFETVKHSVVAMRGCFGGCTFCSITEHEGRVIQSRSADSILRELREIRRMDDFRGVISDVGGPTANMYKMRCKDPAIEAACRRLSCVHPGVCENLGTDHGPVIDLMKRVREAEGIRKVFIASGVRYDLAQLSPEYVRQLATHHTGGQLSVAPEHVSEDVLAKMKKPGVESYERFAEQFACASKEAGKEQYLIPYYISGHPGSTLREMVDLAIYLKSRGLRPRQVQDFIPTPMSLAATMYYTGLDPLQHPMQPVYTARGLREKKLQKSLLLYWDPAHHDFAREALRQAGREDLIGTRSDCLVPPDYSPDRFRKREAARPTDSKGPAGRGRRGGGGGRRPPARGSA